MLPLLSHHLLLPGLTAISSFLRGLAWPQSLGSNNRLFDPLPLFNPKPRPHPQEQRKVNAFPPALRSCLLLVSPGEISSPSPPWSPPAISSQLDDLQEPWPGSGLLLALSSPESLATGLLPSLQTGSLWLSVVSRAGGSRTKPLGSDLRFCENGLIHRYCMGPGVPRYPRPFPMLSHPSFSVFFLLRILVYMNLVLFILVLPRILSSHSLHLSLSIYLDS